MSDICLIEHQLQLTLILKDEKRNSTSLKLILIKLALSFQKFVPIINSKQYHGKFNDCFIHSFGLQTLSVVKIADFSLDFIAN